MNIRRHDDPSNSIWKQGTSELLLELRVQSVETMLSEMGTRISMLEGVVFSLKGQLVRPEGNQPGRTSIASTDPLAHDVRCGDIGPEAIRREKPRTTVYRID